MPSITIDWTWTPRVEAFEVLQCDCVVEFEYRAWREDRRWSIEGEVVGVGIEHFDREANKRRVQWLPMTDPFVRRMAADLEADEALQSQLYHDAVEDMAA